MSYTHVVNEQPMLSSAARTTSGQSSGFRINSFLEGNILINVTAASGTLTIIPSISFDNSSYYRKDLTYEISAIGQYCIPITNFGKYLRADYTITDGGSFTFSLSFMGKE